MKYAVCQVSVAALRAENSDRSEMVSQLLFGEKVEILEIKPNWLKVKTDYDNYIGWVDKKQLAEVSEEEYFSLQNEIYATDSFNLAAEDNYPFTLPLASPLPNLSNGKIELGQKKFNYFGEHQNTFLTKSDIQKQALMYMNTPYLWGGKSIFGIDCSGFVQQVYKMCGVKLPRDAYQQAELGEALSFVEEAEPGDLAFFDNSENKIVHVGIILEGNKIIHAHGRVRIDPVDVTGIFNTDTQSYSHKLRIMKRVI